MFEKDLSSPVWNIREKSMVNILKETLFWRVHDTPLLEEC